MGSKSITQLIADADLESPATHTPHRIKCKCGNIIISTDGEGTCPSCQTIRQVNLDLITSPYYEFQRDRIIVLKKIDREFTAEPYNVSLTKTVDDRT
jgi:hypothetical protein